MVSYLKTFLRELGLKEISILLFLAISSGALFYELYGRHDQTLVSSVNNVWFQSDLKRMFGNMTDRHSGGHYRTNVHPLLSLLTYPPTTALRVLGIGELKAVQIVTASLASLYMLALYGLLRLAGCVRLDALLFSALGGCSAAAMFWLSVPESYAPGAITIVAGLSLAAAANQKPLPAWVYVTVSTMTLSITVTNWMVGILSTFTNNPWRRTGAILLLSLCIVTLLWGVEKYIFPAAGFFMGSRADAQYMFSPNIERIASVLAVFVFHTILSPTITIASTDSSGWPLLIMQKSLPGSAGLLGIVGTFMWSALLGLGIWTLFALKALLSLRIVLGLSLLGQLGLHILYGEETFLYSLHFLPLLVTVTALTTLTHLRKPAIVLTVALIPILAINNWEQLNAADTIATSPRHEVKKHMHSRPQDPWPRSEGHVVLALPGSMEEDKSYHEPGGGFSPGVGTFGVSVWLTNPKGELITTSDTIPLNEISQSFAWDAQYPLPEILTRTQHYSAAWRTIDWKSWQLKLASSDTRTLIPSVLIRSVGPAGGALHDLRWDGESLLINDRWTLTIQPAPRHVHTGEEGAPDWREPTDTETRTSSTHGWAFARVDLDDSTQWTVNIEDLHPGNQPESVPALSPIDFSVDLPDERFVESLNAQIAHLSMGLVGRETRPGEPTNYPLAWQRDGAYVLVALARAGKLDTARMLSRDFAEKDFFGGFGPEADAPGLSLWALGTVASLLGQEEFDTWLWPHVVRKAGLIEEMLQARSNVYKKVEGPIVPKYKNAPELSLVAEPARQGLIYGKMDHQRPILFVNAVSHRGLLQAAKIAVRLGHEQEASGWITTAEQLKRAWENAFTPPWSDNDRTYISALWPSWVATEKRQDLASFADARWKARHDPAGAYNKVPLWTYFELAEAHQWLFLGRQDRAWSTVQWFWNHQSSPGLYTWWEGEGEENSFGRWARVRGWVNPPHVTPHYWTAAEMALLQFDMLGYIDEGRSEPTLVIGGGIPTEWLSKTMNVRGLRVGSLFIDWYWNGKVMKATIRGENQLKARLGSGFPSDAQLELTYSN